VADKTYVRVQGGYVYERIVLDESVDMATLFHPTIYNQLIDVTATDPQPDQDWIYDNGEFRPPERRRLVEAFPTKGSTL
jgi:hypothetical protein